jgi:hypothetical protein
LADLSLIFSLVWKIWLLFFISVNFIPYWESLHTHTHCMSWVIYLKFLSGGKFVLIEYLTLIYIFAYFCNAIWLLYQLIIHTCSEANFWEKYVSAYFPQVSDFQVWRNRTDLFFVQTRAVLPYADLAVAHLDMISIGLRLASISLTYTSLHFYWFIISCCVFFSLISPEILAFFAHLFSSHDLHCVVHYSFKFLCF